jgi:hypothetical protein
VSYDTSVHYAEWANGCVGHSSVSSNSRCTWKRAEQHVRIFYCFMPSRSSMRQLWCPSRSCDDQLRWPACRLGSSAPLCFRPILHSGYRHSTGPRRWWRTLGLILVASGGKLRRSPRPPCHLAIECVYHALLRKLWRISALGENETARCLLGLIATSFGRAGTRFGRR